MDLQWGLVIGTGQEDGGEIMRRCNSLSETFGLRLSEEEGLLLAVARKKSLWESGRVEFGEGILPQLAAAFADSPYLEPDDWAETLCELQDIFYQMKTEVEERLSDRQLIVCMRRYFGGSCRGSLELLRQRELSQLAECLRAGVDPDDWEDEISREANRAGEMERMMGLFRRGERGEEEDDD